MNRTLGMYTVVGTREYRGHKPGTTFECYLDPGPEQRAIYRGDIKLVGRVKPTLPDHWCLPEGWATGHRKE